MSKRAKRSKPGSTRRHLWSLRSHPFVIPITTFMVLFFVAIVGFIGFSGGTTVGATDTHTVTLRIDGKDQVIPTRAATVADLLERLNIKVGPADIVNPSKDTPIDEDSFTLTVYTARPVLVEDGVKKSVAYTAQPTLDAVAKEAGFDVAPEDKLTATPVNTSDPNSVSRDGLIAERLVIQRATPVNLNLYGTSVPVRSQAKTVGALLAEKEIKLSEGDTLQPDVNTPLASNMEVFVVRVGKQIAQVEEDIAPPTEYVEDYNLTAGTTKVQEAGIPGKKLVTYEIEQQNGVEIGRRIIQEIIASQPTRQLVARGKKAPVVVGDKAEIMSAAGISVNQHYAADFIISHESGWKVNSINSRGCGGLGQACPSSKLTAACPNWQSDPVCQMRFFNTYAVNRYGSWTRAMEIWQNQRWW